MSRWCIAFHDSTQVERDDQYPSIATHDKKLIDASFELNRRHNVPRNVYEFQMFYFVTPAIRKTLDDGVHRMRIYMPFGKQWFGYSSRKLKESRAMAGVIIKAIFKKG